jgi:hypothetical protein
MIQRSPNLEPHIDIAPHFAFGNIPADNPRHGRIPGVAEGEQEGPSYHPLPLARVVTDGIFPDSSMAGQACRRANLTPTTIDVDPT